MEKQKKIPQLRFPEFTGEWERKKYGEIFSFRNTNSYSRENLDYDDGAIKNIHYGDIHTKFATLFDITKELVPFVNSEIELKRIAEDNYCKEGDLIIADASEDYEDVGKCIEIINLNGERVLAGLHTILARPDLYKMFIGFSGYLMKSENIRLQIKTIAQGSKVYSISSKRLAEINLVIPEIPEQTRIASFFTVLDKRISELKQKKTLLEQYKKGVMQKLFAQELRFKDDNDKEFPKWEKKTLGELNIYISDGNYGELYPKSDEMKTSGIPFIRANNIKNLKLVWDDMKYIDIEHHKILLSGHLKTNDVLVTTRGDIGMLAYVTEEFNGSNINAQICLLRAGNGLNSFYLLQSLISNNAQKQFKTSQTGSALKQLPKKSLYKIKIELPCLAEQTKIANFLSTIYEKINHTQTQIQQTELYKKGLLQKMFC